MLPRLLPDQQVPIGVRSLRVQYPVTHLVYLSFCICINIFTIFPYIYGQQVFHQSIQPFNGIQVLNCYNQRFKKTTDIYFKLVINQRQLYAVSYVYCKVDRGNLVLMHSVPHFPPNFSRLCVLSGGVQRQAFSFVSMLRN